MMPVLSGLDFLEARAVDDDLRSIPVAILTAHSHEPLRLRNVIGVFRMSADLAGMFEALDEHSPPQRGSRSAQFLTGESRSHGDNRGRHS